jgi:mannose-6-phosphate isomerase-like protein (cupin superfamily)
MNSAERAFPGATGVTDLAVYDSSAPDGVCGGSAHIHLLCTEGYIVVEGSGRLQTLDSTGLVETPLGPGDVVWFTPGTIHRAVNDGDLRIIVIMQNAGLPEAGDAVMTFPPDVLADPDRYAQAASLARSDRVFATDEEAAIRRRDLAITGFAALRDRVIAEGPAALTDFYAAAAALVTPRLAEWERRWQAGPAAVSALTGDRLAALRAGDWSHLTAARVLAEAAPDARHLGMCGRLGVYEL